MGSGKSRQRTVNSVSSIRNNIGGGGGSEIGAPVLDEEGNEVLSNFLNQKVLDSDYDYPAIEEFEKRFGGIVVIGAELNPANKAVETILASRKLTWEDYARESSAYKKAYRNVSREERELLDIHRDFETRLRVVGKHGENADPFVTGYENSKLPADFVQGLIKSNAKVKFRDINLSMKVANTLEKKFEKLGIKGVNQLNFGSFNEPRESRTGVPGFRRGNGSIHINTDWFPDNSFMPKGKFPTQNKNLLGMNFGDGNGVITLVHEYGHHLSVRMGKRYLHDIVGKRVEKKYGKRNNVTSISGYGDESYDEAFAESFAAYCYGVTPRRGKKYHEEFKKVMKEKGLQSFEGCLAAK